MSVVLSCLKYAIEHCSLTMMILFVLLSGSIPNLGRVSAVQYDYYGSQYQPNSQCFNAKSMWATVRSSVGRAPRFQDGYSNICLMAGYSCCDDRMKGEMPDTSYRQLNNILHQRLGLWRDHFRNDSLRLYDYYQVNINESADSLNQMFSNTYGYNYKVNKDFFDQFFQSLRQYMSGERQNIKSVLTDFWTELLRRIVTITESPKSNQDMRRVNCIIDLLINKFPFRGPNAEGEGIPAKIEKMVMKAFPQARIFDNALAIGGEVLDNILKKANLMSRECTILHSRLQYCQLCKGLATIKPCKGYCINVINGCFADLLTSLSTPWTAFIDALERVMTRLNTPYNFPNVNHPFKLIVSEGIMNLQARLGNAKNKKEHYQKCGSPSVVSELRRRRKRQVYGSGYPRDVLTPYVRDAIKKYPLMKNLFSDMANQVCSNPMYNYAPTRGGTSCWNGSNAGQYDQPVARLHNVTLNPEFRNMRLNPTSFSQEVGRLRQITQALLETLEERDPDYIKPTSLNWATESLNRSKELELVTRRKLTVDDDMGGGSGEMPIYNQPGLNPGNNFYPNPSNPGRISPPNNNINGPPQTNYPTGNNIPNQPYIPGGGPRPGILDRPYPGRENPDNSLPIDTGSGEGPPPQGQGNIKPPVDDSDAGNPNLNPGGGNVPEGSGLPPWRQTRPGSLNPPINPQDNRPIIPPNNGDYFKPPVDSSFNPVGSPDLPTDQETDQEGSGTATVQPPPISRVPWNTPKKTDTNPPVQTPRKENPSKPTPTTKSKSTATKNKPTVLASPDLFKEAPPNIWIPEKAAGHRAPGDLTTPPSSANQMINSLNYIVVLMLSGLYAALFIA